MINKFLPAIIFLFLFMPISLFASTGTVDLVNKFAWGENLGWTDFGCDNCHVQVTDTALTGYAWSSAMGWIDLSPTGQGVTNTSSGILGGYAWSSNLGWINFSGAYINSQGKFTGTAGVLGSNAGRINFDCDKCFVKTNWLPNSLTLTLGSSFINLGNLTPVSVKTGSNTLSVSTSAPGGMSIVANGSAPSYGGNSITACATGCSSIPGTRQFGINLTANSSPVVGANPIGDSFKGGVPANYGIANTFRFLNGETIANSSGPINTTVYTVSYIANVDPNIPGGNYVAPITYVVTANF